MIKSIVVITDNQFLFSSLSPVLSEKIVEYDLKKIDYYHSIDNYSFSGVEYQNVIKGIDLKKEYQKLIEKDTLIISLHSKQIFPQELVNNVMCINIHPGFNPYNRGWYPQVFSIINKLPIGATIHLMDTQVDHGPIIDQMVVDVEYWDTSESLYNKIQQLEIELFKKNIDSVLSGNISFKKLDSEGNVNLKKDFEALKEIDLSEKNTFGHFLDRLRALTHGDYNNAFFYDIKGNKVFVKITFELEKND